MSKCSGFNRMGYILKKFKKIGLILISQMNDLVQAIKFETQTI